MGQVLRFCTIAGLCLVALGIVRPGPAHACTNPNGVPGEIIYNQTSDAFQGCTTGGWMAFHGPILPAAACTGPNGVPGEIIYNSDSKAVQGCTLGGWAAFHSINPPAPLGPTGCPTLGDTCADGTIYAGLSMDGNDPMYITPADATGTYSWNNGSAAAPPGAVMAVCDSAPYNTGTCITGKANTVLLAGETNPPNAYAPFEAATHCANLTAHGHSDWYLPALRELKTIYLNLKDGQPAGTFGFQNGNYWTSTEYHSGGYSAWHIDFSVDGQNVTSEHNLMPIRCVRTQ